MDLTNKSELIKYLKQNELWAKKSLGQNFLVDRKVLDKIVEAAELKKTDTVIEIGPGFGVLTEELVKNAGNVVAIEKDEKLVELLSQTSNLKPQTCTSKLKIIKGDVLDLDTNDIFDCHPELVSGSHEMLKQVQHDRNKIYKLVANIPYYITSKILEKFLAAEHKPELIVLLVQKEVAERICAKAGETSVLSIAVQFYGEPEIIDIVKSSSFWPQPKIDSAILKISNVKCHMSDVNEADLFKIVRAGFRSRRKTLVNNLMSGTNLSREELFDILNAIGLEKNVRAQELSVEEWIKLTDSIK